MAARTSVRMQAQIRFLLGQKLSIRQVARALKTSRKTVRRYAQTAGTVEAETAVVAWAADIDWEKVKAEITVRQVTVKQLHREMAPEVNYLRFWREVQKRVPSAPQATIRMPHVAGERCELDYADGIELIDAKTGEGKKTQLFCGVLPFSGYTFGEFVANQKLATFIESQERMWRYFGGVTPYVCIDNLKAGVIRAHLYDPDLNPTYCDYANHMGFAVLPARPYKPRDKASVEAGIGTIQRNFYQEVRDRVFHSLRELNEAFRAYLQRLNSEVMKDHGCSRADRFAAEKDKLRVIPPEAFAQSEWRESKVHPDCHIQVEYNFYSVPYGFIGQYVRVRISARLVEIFSKDAEALTAHGRAQGRHQFVTKDEHYPEKQLGVARFEIRHAKEQATKIGPQTRALVDALIDQDSRPLRHLRRVQGILRLQQSGKVSVEALEFGCMQAIQFKKPWLKYISDCALRFDVHGKGPRALTPERDLWNVFLHEPEEAMRKEVRS